VLSPIQSGMRGPRFRSFGQTNQEADRGVGRRPGGPPYFGFVLGSFETNCYWLSCFDRTTSEW
jgi:hypothetical protein